MGWSHSSYHYVQNELKEINLLLIKIDSSGKKKRLKAKTPSPAPSSFHSLSSLLLFSLCPTVDLVPFNLNYSLILWSTVSGRKMERWNKETDTYSSKNFKVQVEVQEHGQGEGRIKKNSCSSALFRCIPEYNSNSYHGETTGGHLCIYDCT